MNFLHVHWYKENFIITTSSTQCSSQNIACPSQERYKQVQIIITLTLEKSEESKLSLH